MSILLNALLVVAVAVFCADAVVHIGVLSGSTTLFASSEKWLFPALFVVWLPMILLMNRLARDEKQKDIWKASLRAAPKWMRITAYTIFGYAWVGTLASAFLPGADSKLSGARAVSGVMMAFSGMAVCVVYSVIHADKCDDSRRCLNGHRVGPLAKYCEECGAPIMANAAKPFS